MYVYIYEPSTFYDYCLGTSICVAASMGDYAFKILFSIYKAKNSVTA